MVWKCAFLAMILATSAAAGSQNTNVLYFENTVSLYFDDPEEGLVTYGTTRENEPFDIVVLAKMRDPSSAMEFVITELTLSHPGVYRFATTLFRETLLDVGDASLGEYMLTFEDCIPAGEHELVRLSYYDTAGSIANDLLEIRGFQSGDTQPSSYLGRTAYRDCEGVAKYLEPEPSKWLLGGSCGPPAGSCVLNAGAGFYRCSPGERISMSVMKARF